MSFRSGVFREDLIKGQGLTLGLEGLGRIEIRGEEWGGGRGEKWHQIGGRKDLCKGREVGIR